MSQEFNVLALIKADQRYVFVYDDASEEALLEAFRCWAADPALNFTWFDAAVLTEKARQQAAERTMPASPGRPVSRFQGI